MSCFDKSEMIKCCGCGKEEIVHTVLQRLHKTNQTINNTLLSSQNINTHTHNNQHYHNDHFPSLDHRVINWKSKKAHTTKKGSNSNTHHMVKTKTCVCMHVLREKSKQFVIYYSKSLFYACCVGCHFLLNKLSCLLVSRLPPVCFILNVQITRHRNSFIKNEARHICSKGFKSFMSVTYLFFLRK